VLADQGRTSVAAAALAEILAPEAHYAAESERRRRAEADAADSGSMPRGDRGVLTPRAQGPGRRPVPLAAVPVLLVGLLVLVRHFETRIGFFMVATSDPPEQDYPFTPDDLGRLVAAGPLIVAVAVACVAVQVLGAWTRNRQLRSEVARAYVAVSAVVHGLAAAALAALGVAATTLGSVALTYENEGMPAGYVPDACRAAVAAAVAVLGGIYLFVVSLRRLALALFGGRVIVR
jgi:hypothetical protein